jgi:succinate dehydrogenase / fumarate reductase cytochrome b subunit
MATSLKEQPLKRRPVYRNLHIKQLTTYRLPAPAIASISHRISGAFLFLLLPFAIWLFDTSVTSEVSYEHFTAAFAAGVWGLPGWLVKLLAFALLWAYLVHFCVGVRHVWMDLTHDVGLAFGRTSAVVALALGTVVAFALGAKLFLA